MQYNYCGGSLYLSYVIIKYITKTKRVFKEKIINFLNTIDTIPEGKKLNHEKKDFILRIYQGKSKPDVVTLKLDSYNRIQPQPDR